MQNTWHPGELWPGMQASGISVAVAAGHNTWRTLGLPVRLWEAVSCSACGFSTLPGWQLALKKQASHLACPLLHLA